MKTLLEAQRSEESKKTGSVGPKVHCEISIIPMGGKKEPQESDVEMGREIAAAFSSIKQVAGIKLVLTPMGTQIEAERIEDILEAIKSAHDGAKASGAMRIISSIKIDQRLDKDQSLEDKVRSVEEILKANNNKISD